MTVTSHFYISENKNLFDSMWKEYVKRSTQESLKKLTKDVHSNEIHLTFIKISTKL